MMGNSASLWTARLVVDPVPLLRSSGSKAVAYFAARDLADEMVPTVRKLWALPEVERILRRQRDDGSWRYAGRKKDSHSTQEYDQLETYRVLGWLVEKYGMDDRHPAVNAAAEFLFSFQTEEGDFRGIYGRQYTPNYSGAIMELLIKAGYQKDPRVEAGFKWLDAVRQVDGGWAIPVSTADGRLDADTMRAAPIEFSLARPSSHLVTGMVLRAYAAHRRKRRSREAREAGELLASRFFQRDRYTGRQSPDYWARVSYPFWFTDIVSALDSLWFVAFTAENIHIDGALRWLAERQRSDGLFDLKILRDRDRDAPHWVSLAVSRQFKRYGVSSR
jgi:hypothetical protein